ncbi:HTH-type transcriptional regulator GalS [Mixta theicola]|nr:extracellular solute-binding protein [Mixta theicola]QHM76505.1 HTH-type transcriptional regulator GalS [Mixta theicola]
MKKITIKDIAKLAKVSHGTVSNVLNNNGNVSVEKIDAVMKAAREVGYQLNVRASALRANDARSIAVVLPEIHSEQTSFFYHNLLSEILSQGGITSDIDLFISHSKHEAEREIISKISGKVYKKAVVFSVLDSACEWYEKSSLAEKDIIFVYHWPRKALNRFSVNYYQAGMDIASELKFEKNVCLFCESGSYSYICDLISGFQGGSSSVPNFFFTDEKSLHNDAINLVGGNEYNVFITTSQRKASALFTALNLTRMNNDMKVYVLGAAGNSIAGEQIQYYQMDYAELGKVVAIKLFHDEEKSEKVIDNTGFKPSSAIEVIKDGASVLKVLMNISPSSEAIRKILPNFKRRSGLDVELDTLPAEEVNRVLADENRVSQYDIVRIDIALLPAYSRNLLTPLEKISPEIAELVKGYNSEVRKLSVGVDGLLYAVPFDVGPQMLFYRKDLFDDAKVKRLYFERYRAELSVPDTFEKYDRVCEFFHYIHNELNANYPLGATAFVASPDLLASEFLLRYYALGGTLLADKDIPSIDITTGISALESYLEYIKLSEKSNQQWWDSAVENFEKGKTALLITYSNLLNDTAHGKMSGMLGCAPVPGEVSQLGGGSLGIVRNSAMMRPATEFIKWLDEDYIVEHRVLLGSGCMSSKALNNNVLKDTYPWMPYMNTLKSRLLRETVSSDSQPYNILEAEHIIGCNLMYANRSEMSAENTINNINKELSEHFYKRDLFK